MSPSQEIPLLKYTIFLLFCGLTITGMILGAQLLIPMTWALLFSFVLFPVCRFLEKKKFKRAWAAVAATILFCLVSGFILFFLIYQAAIILKGEGALLEKVKEGLNQLNQTTKSRWGVNLFPGGGSFQPMDVVRLVAGHVSMIGSNLVTLTLIPMYLFFMLNYRDVVHKYVVKKFKGTELKAAEDFLHRAQSSIENYLLGTLLLTCACAVMSFIILLLFGIEYAYFFAVFIAVLNLIPYVGNLLAFIVVLLYVWLSSDSMSTATFVGLSLYASNLIQENFLRPALIGDKMEMNAGMVFTAVVVGGMVWGFSGMVLFIPLLGILQALLDSKEEWKPYALFFKS